MFLRRLNTIHYITNNLNKKSMKKKKYEKPSLEVVVLKQQPTLLAGSQLDGQLEDPEDYLPEDDPFNFAREADEIDFSEF